jgi:hypothetical protein
MNPQDETTRSLHPAAPAGPTFTCLGCGYSLAGLPAGPCPECGRRFDPADPATVARPGYLIWRKLASARPPRSLLLIVSLILIPCFLALGNPTGMVSDWAAMAIGLLVFATILIWTIPFACHLLGRCVLLGARIRQPRWSWRWGAIPVLLVACIYTQSSGALWQVRWWLARPAFERIAAGAATPHWIGSFRIIEIHRNPDGSVVFLLGWTDPYSDGPAAILHSPTRRHPAWGWPHPQMGWPLSHDLGGGWWLLIDHT